MKIEKLNHDTVRILDDNGKMLVLSSRTLRDCLRVIHDLELTLIPLVGNGFIYDKDKTKHENLFAIRLTDTDTGFIPICDKSVENDFKGSVFLELNPNVLYHQIVHALRNPNTKYSKAIDTLLTIHLSDISVIISLKNHFMIVYDPGNNPATLSKSVEFTPDQTENILLMASAKNAELYGPRTFPEDNQAP